MPGYCGCLLSMAQVRISDEGEVQLKGGMSMTGYYKNPEASQAVLTEDGWFKTGDIGELYHKEKNGERLTYIKITDRIKELIITAGGKNISPQQIESLVGNEVFISSSSALAKEESSSRPGGAQLRHAGRLLQEE